ncbi:MAG: hypothetical protein PHQ34_16150, partial [Methanothrix sp.]|nr:hypothetical protein [Methanothrix sp.]
KLHRLRHSLITTLSGTIEKDGTERTVRKDVDHRNKLRQKAKKWFHCRQKDSKTFCFRDSANPGDIFAISP